MRHESLLLLNEFQCAHTSCWLNALSFKHERKRVCYLSRSGGNSKFKRGKKDSRDEDIKVLTVERITSAKNWRSPKEDWLSGTTELNGFYL